MKDTLTKKMAYLGAGAGIMVFAFFGLLPGSLLGGAAGIKFAGMIFGTPLDPNLISRAIVLTSSLAGILISGIAIVTAASTAGWMLGKVISLTAPEKAAEATVMVRK